MRTIHYKQNNKRDFSSRRYWLLFFLTIGMLMLAGRAVFLQICDTKFLRKQGDKRHISFTKVIPYRDRGNILDRNGKLLAISLPMDSVYVDPQYFKRNKNGDLDYEMLQKLKQIAVWLKVSDKKMMNLYRTKTKRFAYLKRQVNPQLVIKVKALKVPGVYFKKEFKRYYPVGAISAHTMGFTDIDDIGQEGMERGYEHILRSVNGQKKVIRDGKRRIINYVENINDSIDGQDIVLSIDQSIQYLAHRELQKAVIKHKALSASLVVLDANNGEILAVANQPDFNPHIRKQLKANVYRNRALLDIFEPGSTVKPFVMAAALDGGYIHDSAKIDTQGGSYKIGGNVIKDTHNYGTLDLTNVLKKSSNVAISKIALKMPKEYFWGIYNQLGFGVTANAGFPGETTGKLLDWQQWHDFEQATLAFGYGVSMSVLQLARAYTALADDGILHSVSMLKRDNDYDTKRVFSRKTAKKIKKMLEQVVKKDGTAYQAKVDGYRVAGKTGTVKKSVAGGYADNNYLAMFVGLAPASKPRFVIAVIVNEPTNGQYYGGQVAAPIFAKVMAGALRIYNVASDAEYTTSILLTSAQ